MKGGARRGLFRKDDNTSSIHSNHSTKKTSTSAKPIPSSSTPLIVPLSTSPTEKVPLFGANHIPSSYYTNNNQHSNKVETMVQLSEPENEEEEDATQKDALSHADLVEKDQLQQFSENPPASIRSSNSTSNSALKKKRRLRIRRVMYKIFEGGSRPLFPFNKIVEYFILFLIFFNVIQFILSTVDWIEDQFGTLMDVIECIIMSIFTLEFLIRLWVCVEKHQYKKQNSILARLKYVFLSFSSLLDLFVIGLYWIQQILVWSNVFHYQILAFVSALRVIRVLQIFKAEKHTFAIRIILKIVNENREVFNICFILGFILLVITSTGLYYAEKDHNPELYGDIPRIIPIGFVALLHFSKIINSNFSKAVLMLAGQAQPDPASLTVGGKIIVCITAIISIALFCLPAAIIAISFQPVAEEIVKEKEKRARRSLRSLEQLHREDVDSESEEEEEEDLGVQIVGDTCPTCKQHLSINQKPLHLIN